MKKLSDQVHPMIILGFFSLLPIFSYFIWLYSSSSVLQSLAFMGACNSVLLGISTRENKAESLARYWSILMIGSGILLLFGICWNAMYAFYITMTGYSGDIFRGTFQNYHSPVYGVANSSSWPWCFPLLLYTFAFIVRIIFWQPLCIEKRELTIEMFLWFLGFLFFFPLSDGPERLFEFVSHYQSFSLDLPRFSGITDVFQTYTEKMFDMSMHNGHYPPGNLLLIMIGPEFGRAWFVHSIVLLSTCLTGLVICEITKTLNFSIYARQVALGLFITCPSVLIFPSVSMAAVQMFLSAMALWASLLAVQKKSFLLSVAVGLLMMLYSLFSFTSIIVGFLLLTVSTTHIINKKIRLGTLLWLGSLAIFSFLLSCWSIYIVTGFNWFSCLMIGVEHNQNSMASGYDSLMRYLLRSSGNLIAWLLSIGFIASVYGIFSIVSNFCNNQESCQNTNITYCKTVVITVIVVAFSTLFFLETERIWLCFVPAWIIATASFFDKEIPKDKVNLLKGILIFSIVFAVGQEVLFQSFSRV